MALKETLRLVVEADTRGAVKQIENVGNASEKAGKKTKNNLDSIGHGFTKVGAGMIGFGAVALAGLGGLAKMSEEANLATVKLDNTLSNMPKLAGENAKQFTDLATKIQGYTAADADAIVEAEAMLGTFNLTAQQIKSITPLVVDYSRKFGVDMVSAATQVGKALDGNVGALKRNGVSIDEAKFKTDRYTAVQEALSNQVGGFAAAEGATFAGSLERMKNQLGDLAEGVGGGAVDAFTTMFGAVGKVAGALDKISPGAQNAAGKIATFASVGVIAAGALSTIIGQAILARQRFGQLAEGVGALRNKMGGLSSVAKAGGIVATIGALVLEARHLNDEANKLDVDKFASALTSVGDGSREAQIEMVKASMAFGHLERDITALAESNVPAARNMLELAKSLGLSEDQVRKLNKVIEEKKQEDIGGQKAQQDYTDEVDNATDALGGEADAATSAADAIKAKTDAELAAIDPLFALQDALTGNADAQGEVKAKQLEAAAAQGAYNAAVAKFGPKSKEAVDAYFAMVEAQDAVTDAQGDAVRSAGDVERATADLRAEIEENPAALDTAKRKLQQWQAQGLITADQAKKTAREFDDLAGSIRKVPGSKNIIVRVRGSGDARTKILTIRDALGQLHDKTLTIGVTTAIGKQASGIMSSKMFGGQFADGGTVPGQRGEPKVIIAHGGEKILSLEDQAKMVMRTHMAPVSAQSAAATGGGGGGQVNVNVNILGEGLMRYLRNQVRLEYGGDVQAALGTRR